MTPEAQEVAELLQRFADEEAEAAEAQRVASLEGRKRLAEKARRGDIPDHFKKCAQCLGALLAMKGRTAGCEAGQRFPNFW